MTNNNFDEQIKDWGKSKRTLPIKNDSIKQTIFAATDANRGQTVKPKRRTKTWLISGIALAGTAICVMLVFNFVRSQLIAATSVSTDDYNVASQSGYAEGSATVQTLAVAPRAATYNSVSVDSLGLSYGEATGLGSSEPNIIKTIATNIVSGIAHQAGYDESGTLDTREYMDTNYSINIKTREVQEKAESARTVVRGHDGRIDRYNASENSAYISFTVPRTKFDAMAEEIRALAFSDKFITESINEYNRLPEKQNIEGQTADCEQTASELEVQRADLEKSHAEKSASLQKTINDLNKRIDALRIDLASATGTMRAKISVQITALNRDLSASNKSLSSENSQYNTKIKNIDKQIKQNQSTLENLGEQDQNLIDDTNVVTGTISLRKTSVLETINLYVPFRYSIPGLILILILYAIFGRNRKIEVPV